MDYLTNHYKNLSEQLQERVNQLQNILNEGRAVQDPVTGEWTIVRGDLDDRPALAIDLKALMKTYGKPSGKLDLSGMGKLNPSGMSKIDFPMHKGAQNNQTDGETDEDIIGMRQTAADQGGIPQDMVNDPIERTKQLPDGRTIHSKTVQPPKVRPNIGGAGPMIPKKPLAYPTPSLKDKNKVPNLLDKDIEKYGIIPQTPEQRKKFGMSTFDNRMS